MTGQAWAMDGVLVHNDGTERRGDFDLVGTLGHVVRLLLHYAHAAGQIAEFVRDAPAGAVLGLRPNENPHLCDLCGQTFPTPVHALNLNTGIYPDDSRRVCVVLGVCDGCEAERLTVVDAEDQGAEDQGAGDG